MPFERNFVNIIILHFFLSAFSRRLLHSQWASPPSSFAQLVRLLGTMARKRKRSTKLPRSFHTAMEGISVFIRLSLSAQICPFSLFYFPSITLARTFIYNFELFFSFYRKLSFIDSFKNETPCCRFAIGVSSIMNYNYRILCLFPPFVRKFLEDNDSILVVSLCFTFNSNDLNF